MHELLVEGGGERQCLSLARTLTRQGHQVTLYTSAYDRSNCFPDICKELTIREIGRGRFAWLRKPRFVRCYLDMRRLTAAVGTRHDLWNPHHWPAQWGAVWLKRKLGGKIVWMCNDVPTFHQISRKQGLGLLGRLIHRLYYLYDRRENRKVDLTLFLSRWAESEFKLIYRGRTRVVRSGADPDRFQPGGNHEKIRKRFGYQTDDFVLLWLGIFMPHRRLEDAIEALAHLKHKGVRVRLLLAGSGDAYPDYFRWLKDQVQKLG